MTPPPYKKKKKKGLKGIYLDCSHPNGKDQIEKPEQDQLITRKCIFGITISTPKPGSYSIQRCFT